MEIIIIYSILLIFLIGLFIFMIVNKIKNSKKNSNDKFVTDKSILDILTVADYDDIHDCFVYVDNTCMDILQIRSKDLENASHDSVQYDHARFTRFLRKYSSDLKLIIMNFPSNTAFQQAYLDRKILKTKNEIFKNWLQKKKDELEWIENNRTTREFYIMFWGVNNEDIVKQRDIIIRNLGVQRDGLVNTVDKVKKKAIIRKLCNKNSTAIRKGK